MNHETTEDLINQEQPTKDLTDSDKLDLILAELADLRRWRAGVDARLMKVEAFVEDRSRDTRPKLEMLHEEIADTRIEMREGQARLEDQLEHVKTKLDLMIVDIADVRTVQHRLGVRVSALEQRPS